MLEVRRSHLSAHCVMNRLRIEGLVNIYQMINIIIFSDEFYLNDWREVSIEKQ